MPEIQEKKNPLEDKGFDIFMEMLGKAAASGATAGQEQAEKVNQEPTQADAVNPFVSLLGGGGQATQQPAAQPKPQGRSDLLAPEAVANMGLDAILNMGKQQLNNESKEKDGTGIPLENRTYSVGERTAKELKKFQDEMEYSFWGDNLTNLLVMAGGTGLQIAGLMGGGPALFMGGQVLSNLGGDQIDDWYRTKTQEQEAAVKAVSQEPASGRDLQSVLDMAQQRVNETGKSIPESEIEQMLGLVSLSQTQANWARNRIRAMAPGAAVQAELGSMEREATTLVHKYMSEMGIVGTPTASEKKQIKAFVQDQSRLAPKESALINLRTDQGAGKLDEIIETATTFPVSAEDYEEYSPEQKAGVYSESKEFWIKGMGAPVPKAVVTDEVGVKSKVAFKHPLLMGLGDAGKDVVSAPYGKVADKIHGNLRSEWEVRGNQVFLNVEFPKIASYSQRPSAAGVTVYDERAARDIPVFRSPLTGIGSGGVDAEASRRLNQAMTNRNLFSQEFIEYYSKLLEEAIVK